MGPLCIGLARCAFSEQTRGVLIALEHVIGLAHKNRRMVKRLKRIEADSCLQYLDGSRGLARIRQGSGVSIVDEIGIERQGSLEFGDGGVVLALEKQGSYELSVSFRPGDVEVHSRLRQFKGAIERSRTEIIAVERFDISVEVSPGQHRSGARVIGVDRQASFEETPCVIEQCFRAPVVM